MKNRKLYMAAMLMLAAIAVTACGAESGVDSGAESNESANVDLQFITTELSDEGTILVDTSKLTEYPKFINYDAGGTIVQLIAVKASDGSSRLSLNTCQSCNPSPMAYYKEENGKLVCQNCGNTFTMDSVGSLSGGCNPMNLEYDNNGDYLVVRAEVLDGYADKFNSWQGPTE